MHLEYRFAGVGGQGAILAGVIFANAMIRYENKHAVQSPSYTAAVRGGPTKVDVIVDDDPIIFPRATNINVMLSFHEKSYHAFAYNLADDVIIVADTDLNPGLKPDERTYLIPFYRIAKEVIGKVQVANVIALGAIYAVTGIPKEESLRQAIKDRVPPAFVDLNMKAFDEGVKRIEELLKNR